MSLWQFKQLKCDLGLRHKISKVVERNLYSEASKKIEAHCERCNASLILEIDPTDAEYYIVSEI